MVYSGATTPAAGSERTLTPDPNLPPEHLPSAPVQVETATALLDPAGVLLVILPWTPEWTDNYLLLSFPWLRTVVTTGFFRGLCSGLGLLDIWIGFWEALHYHEHQ